MDLASKILKRPVRTEHRHRAVQWSLVAGPVSLILTLLMAFTLLAAWPKSTDPLDFTREQSRFDAAQNWGRNYLLLWAAGSSKQISTLAAMTSAQAQLKLPSTPYVIQEITPATTESIPAGEDTEWVLSYDTLVVVPGQSSVMRVRYTFNVVQHLDGYQVIALPRPTTQTTTPFKVTTVYTAGIGEDSSLAIAAKNFLRIYLTGGGDASLGSTVSSSFRGRPLTRSPYTAVTTLSIFSTATPYQPSAGDSASILVTVQGNATADTFHISQYPLTMVYTDQGQWVVDGIEDAVDFGHSKVG